MSRTKRDRMKAALHRQAIAAYLKARDEGDAYFRQLRADFSRVPRPILLDLWIPAEVARLVSVFQPFDAAVAALDKLDKKERVRLKAPAKRIAFSKPKVAP